MTAIFWFCFLAYFDLRVALECEWVCWDGGLWDCMRFYTEFPPAVFDRDLDGVLCDWLPEMFEKPSECCDYYSLVQAS